jgi:hypothetical protein
MNKKLLVIIGLLFSSLSFTQIRNYDTYSLEGSYGITGFQDSHNDGTNIKAIGHVDFGFRWMRGRVWGIKIDMGIDKTRVVDFFGVENGCDYKRYSLQGICNFTNLTTPTEAKKHKFNLFAHFGGGYASQTSTIISGTDEIGNLIFGINPQYSIADGVNIGIDLTGIGNFSRQFDFNGSKITNGSGISETGFIYNASLTLTYTFWK